MIGVIVNAVAVIAGSLIGILFKKGINENLANTVMKIMGLVMILLGVKSSIETENMLCIVVCLVVGTVVGEILKIDDGINYLGDSVKTKFKPAQEEGSKFTEGFVTATLLFCIGSMTIVGSMEAGTNHDYSILFAKSVMDGVSSIMFAAVFGVGVMLSAVALLITQGALTLLAASLTTVLTDAMITEISAVGGLILIGMAFNMLFLNEKGTPIKVANMIPGILLPPLYLAITGIL